MFAKSRQVSVRRPLVSSVGFQARLQRLSLDDLEILPPICVLDLSYLDWCVVAHDEAEDECRRLHEVLFPTAPFDYPEAVAEYLDPPARQRAERKWRNRQLDVLPAHTRPGWGRRVRDRGHELQGSSVPRSSSGRSI